jgi:hypothetical protein
MGKTAYVYLHGGRVLTKPDSKNKPDKRARVAIAKAGGRLHSSHTNKAAGIVYTVLH